MLVYQKTISERYYCIKSFCHFKILEKMLRKAHFCSTIMARKSMEELVEFENACSRAKTYVNLRSRYARSF